MGASSFNEMEMDAIGEMMNISLGASATAVSTMLGRMVNITTPVVSVVDSQEFEFKKLEPAVGVEISYVQGLDGSNIMMFSRNDVRIIVGILMGCEIPEAEFELDEINRSAICEVMNQMMGASATALSEFLGTTVNISTPTSFAIEDEAHFKEKYFPLGDTKVVVRFTLEIEGTLNSEFLNIMSVDLAKRLLEPFEVTFSSMESSSPAQESTPAAFEPEEAAEPQMAEESSGGSQASMDQSSIDGALREAAAQAEEPSGGTQASMDQSAIDRALREAAAQEPATQPVQPQMAADSMQGQSVQPQMAANPMQGQPVQPPYPQYQPPYPQPQYQMPAADPMMLQLLNQMQQSQMHMMEMMRSMEDKDKEREAREKERASQKSKEPSLIRPVNATPLEQTSGEGGEERANQEMLMKVPLEISVEIGRTKKLVKDILEFTQGSLVVLDKMAGEQADLYVNGQCIAKGDIVVVEDNFGIRITEIVARNLNPESL